jgi:septal ring factor EnvC (AmiA/AmiB activator)
MHVLTRHALMLSLAALLCGACLAVPIRAEPAPGRESRSDIEERIERQKERMEQGKESLSELSRRESELYSELAGIKDRIERLASRMEKQEDKLRHMRRKREELQSRNKELMRGIAEKKRAARNMLAHMWPLFVKNKGLGPGSVEGLANIRRNYAWLRSIYRMARQELASLDAEQKRLSANLRRLQDVEGRISEGLLEIEDTKDELLENKLTYLKKLQDVRAQRLAKREQLERIRETIGELRYRLQNTKIREIAKLKGSLPWPAEGRVVSVDGEGRESGRGLALSLEKGQKVRSVAWGKVVYNDKLRGFGRVVILLHGQDYYSLYAYLLSSRVEMGQKIDKGEILGRAGFYPQVNGPGLYFELRRGQQPIDPEPWLGSKSGRG